MRLFKGPWIDQHGIIQDGPEMMDEDEVVKTYLFMGVLFYGFDRFDHAYDSQYFATLPDQTAEEMQEQEHESIIM